MLSILILCVVTQTTVATLDLKQVPVEKKELFVPPLKEIARVLNEGLKEHYGEVRVDVVDCPDLTQPPFTLANVGLNGNTRVVETGGVQYLYPLPNLTKVYDIRHVLQVLDLSSALVIGAGSGPHLYCGINCEGTYNVYITGDKIDQQSRLAIVQDDGSYVVEMFPNNETRFSTFSDYFVSEGKPGPVLRIYVHKRVGSDPFSVCIRKTLANHYGTKIVGLGGAFVLKQGKALHHVLPDFSKTPLNTWEEISNWLKWYNMSAPLIGVGTILTGSFELDLSLEHFHTFSHHGEAGHYHIDTTAETAEYLGYFNTAEYAYGIDIPPPSNF